jgi:hypothetical protein
MKFEDPTMIKDRRWRELTSDVLIISNYSK